MRRAPRLLCPPSLGCVCSLSITHCLYGVVSESLTGNRTGFDRKRTFIFSDFQYMGGEFYKNCVRIAKARLLAHECSISRSIDHPRSNTG